MEQILTRLVVAKNDIAGRYLTPLFLLIITSTLIYFFKNDRPKAANYLFSIIWFLVGVIGLGLYKQHIYDHYFGFIFPSIFILLAVALTSLPSVNRLLLIPASGIVLFLTYLSYQQLPLRFPPNRQLATTNQITQSILQRSSDQPFNLALLAKQNYDPPYRYIFELSQSPLYLVNEKVTNQLFVICEPWQMECQPLGHPLWDIAAFGQAKIVDQWNIKDIQVYKLEH